MIPKPAILGGILAVAAIGFLVGRATAPAGQASAASAGTSAPSSEPGAFPSKPNRALPGRNLPPPPPGPALATPSPAMPAPGVDPQAFDETPAQRDARHQQMDAYLTKTLPELSAKKRAALIDLNDEATEIQRKMRVELMGGELSDADYQAQQHDAVLHQLEEMRAIVNDDEYRKLTGLEPGVDPYQYMQTGKGGAPSSNQPAPTHVDTDEKHGDQNRK